MKIYKGKGEFNYGNCFIVAIGQAFNIRIKMLNVMFKLINVPIDDGASTKECNKVIQQLGDFRDKHVIYHSLKSPILVIEFITKNKKGIFLLNCDGFPEAGHLCYYRNGKLKDSFYNGNRKRLTEDKLLGYWEIKDKCQIVAPRHYIGFTTQRYG